jgi:hypothetical protein
MPLHVAAVKLLAHPPLRAPCTGNRLTCCNCCLKGLHTHVHNHSERECVSARLASRRLQCPWREASRRLQCPWRSAGQGRPVAPCPRFLLSDRLRRLQCPWRSAGPGRPVAPCPSFLLPDRLRPLQAIMMSIQYWFLFSCGNPAKG